MHSLLVALVLLILIFLAVNLLFSRRLPNLPFLPKPKSAKNSEETLTTRVRPVETAPNSAVEIDVFAIELRGLIRTQNDSADVNMEISISDITDGINKAQPVYSNVEQYQKKDSGFFLFNSAMGALPHKITIITNWLTATELKPEWMVFPRKGRRKLLFQTAILCSQTGKTLANAFCVFDYENPSAGYIDSADIKQRTKTLAVSLAFAVGAADGQLPDCEIEIIENWVKQQQEFLPAAGRQNQKLEKALDTAINFFSKGNKINIKVICDELIQTASPADRCDILELCMRVAGADGVASKDELSLLSQISGWLEIGNEKFRDMMAKILPPDMHQTEDANLLLGITADSTGEQLRQQLNQEYRKWNARVTNSDPKIRTQADRMIKLIAQTRSKFDSES